MHQSLTFRTVGPSYHDHKPVSLDAATRNIQWRASRQAVGGGRVLHSRAYELNTGHSVYYVEALDGLNWTLDN